jgi:hypothetical protein
MQNSISSDKSTIQPTLLGNGKPGCQFDLVVFQSEIEIIIILCYDIILQRNPVLTYAYNFQLKIRNIKSGEGIFGSKSYPDSS